MPYGYRARKNRCAEWDITGTNEIRETLFVNVVYK